MNYSRTVTQVAIVLFGSYFDVAKKIASVSSKEIVHKYTPLSGKVSSHFQRMKKK